MAKRKKKFKQKKTKKRIQSPGPGTYSFIVLDNIVSQTGSIEEVLSKISKTDCPGRDTKDFHNELRGYIGSFDSFNKLQKTINKKIEELGGREYLDDLHDQMDFLEFIDGRND